MSFEPVAKFEEAIASYFGAPYAVAVDCCTHGIELCLRQQNVKSFSTPKRTYISVPFLGQKLNIEHTWRDEVWQDFYYLGGTNIIDAAVPWREQDISTVGYHYYMTPETAQLGLDKLQNAIDTEPTQWTVTDWPDLTQMEIFK